MVVEEDLLPEEEVVLGAAASAAAASVVEAEDSREAAVVEGEDSVGVEGRQSLCLAILSYYGVGELGLVWKLAFSRILVQLSKFAVCLS